MQDSDKVLAADKLAQTLETVVDSPDGEGSSRKESEDRRRRQAVVAAPPANE